MGHVCTQCVVGKPLYLRLFKDFAAFNDARVEVLVNKGRIIVEIKEQRWVVHKGHEMGPIGLGSGGNLDKGRRFGEQFANVCSVAEEPRQLLGAFARGRLEVRLAVVLPTREIRPPRRRVARALLAKQKHHLALVHSYWEYAATHLLYGATFFHSRIKYWLPSQGQMRWRFKPAIL